MKWMLGRLVTGLILLLASNALAAEPASQPASAAPSSLRGYDAASWPQWRGPNRDGIAPAGPKLLDAWPKEGPKLLWKSEVPSFEKGGGGCVVVADGRAFVYVNWLHQLKKVVLTTDYLKELGWVEDIPADLAKKIEQARISEARAKTKDPELDAYVQDFLKTLDPDLARKFRAHIETRLKTGRKDYASWANLVEMAKFRDKEFASVRDLWQTIGEYNLSPAVLKHLVEGTSSGTDTVVCWDAGTGKQLWKKEFPGTLRWSYMGNCGYGASGTPAVSGDRLYVQGSVGLYCLAAKDGAAIWQKETPFSNSSPLVANGAVFVTYPDLTAYDAETGRLLWKTPAGAGGYCGPNYSVVPWASGGKTYIVGVSDGGGGGLYCVEPETGKALWKVPDVGSGEGSSTPVISGDVAAFFGKNAVFAFRLTPEKAEQLWKSPPATWRASTAVIYKDCVYVDGNGLRCIDLKTGNLNWIAQVGAQYSSPVVADGKLIFLSGNSHYSTFVAMAKTRPEKYEELGRFPKPHPEHGIVATCTSPTVADGRLYLRLEDGVACYDLTEAGNR